MDKQSTQETQAAHYFRHPITGHAFRLSFRQGVPFAYPHECADDRCDEDTCIAIHGAHGYEELSPMLRDCATLESAKAKLVWWGVREWLPTAPARRRWTLAY